MMGFCTYSYSTLSSAAMNIPEVNCFGVHKSLYASVCQENTSDKWVTPSYSTSERTLYHVIENTVASKLAKKCDKRAAGDGKVGCNT